MSNELINKADAQLPAHLAAAAQSGDTGLEGMNQYIVPPRVKIVQDKRSDDYKQFSGGDVIITPQLETVCNKDGFFVFTPLFVYDEFCVHNPYQLRAQLPMIRERSLDPKSEVADLCRKMHSEPCPENSDHQIKYVTHLNFVIAVHDVPALAGIEVLMSFSLGEFKTGSNLLGLLRMRCNNGTPIYAHKLMARPSEHSNSGNEWWGLDITNPTADYEGSPWVEDAALFESFKNMNEQLKSNRDLIQADYDDGGEKSAPSSNVVESDTL